MPRGQSGCHRLVSGRVGTCVQPVQGENYTYSRVLSHVQLLIQLHFHRVVLPDFYIPLVYFLARIAVEVREWESSHRLGGFSFLWRCVCNRESGMPEWPVLRCLDDAACIGNPAYPLATLLFFCIHLKLAYGWRREPIPYLGKV